METFYLICFGVGLLFSLLAFVSGSGHLHIGHLHLHAAHVRAGHARLGHASAAKPGSPGGSPSALNGFTLPAFLCWFGGTGYLMAHAGVLPALAVLFFASVSGLAGASLLYGVIFKLLLPRERVLSREDTEMAGVVARISQQIRPNGIGEILFSQTGARRSSAARSEDGTAIPRGAEVLVLRYERGVAYVRPWDETEALARPAQTGLEPAPWSANSSPGS
jgi:hypothetical protein